MDHKAQNNQIIRCSKEEYIGIHMILRRDIAETNNKYKINSCTV